MANETLEDTPMKLSAPWIGYARELMILFGQDPEITVSYDPDNIAVTLYVNNPVKADAMSKIIPTERDFGGNILKIAVVPANTDEDITDIYRKAFNGNPIFKDIISTVFAPGVPGNTYIMFDKEPAQFYNDQFNNPDGIKTALYEDIARDALISYPGIFFNSETGNDFIVWP